MTATDQELLIAGSHIRRINILRARRSELKHSYAAELGALDLEIGHLENQCAEIAAERGPITTVWGSIRFRRSTRTIVGNDGLLLAWATEHYPQAVHHTTSPTALVAAGCVWRPSEDRDLKVLVTPDGEMVPLVQQQIESKPTVVSGKLSPVEHVAFEDDEVAA